MKRTTSLKLLAMALLALACHAPWTHSSSSQPAPLSTAQGGAAAPSADPFADARSAIDAARQIGLPPGNYRVDVERIWVSESDVSAIGAMFMYSGGGVVAAGGAPAAAPGFMLGVVGKSGFTGLSVAKTCGVSRNSFR